MFNFCPSCASRNICFERNKLFRCPDCGFLYYHNVAAAAACIIETNEGIVFLTRSKDPSKGKLDLPGGFIDQDEGAVEGMRRECLEELGTDFGAAFSFFASFPNDYLYKGIDYKTCDLYFAVSAPDLKASDIRLDPNENSGVRIIKPADINFDELAFEAGRRAVKAVLERQPSGAGASNDGA
jgi:8-oxo-dGTP pyrophosphatase MutT (NUDIX family)